MIPVDQTTFGDGVGNCFSACVASILHLKVDEVPFFCGVSDWWSYCEQWLKERGASLRYVRLFPYKGSSDEITNLISFNGVNYVALPSSSPIINCDKVYIAIGDSNGAPGVNHACIVRGNPIEIVHDPNPNRKGIVDIITLIEIY